MTTIRRFWGSKFVRDTVILQIGKIGVAGLSFLSSILVFRLLGVERFGLWALTQSFFTIWQSLDLTGVNISTSTRLGLAVGRQDADEIASVMAFHALVSGLWALAVTALILLLGPPLSRLMYDGSTRIAVLTAWLSLTVLPDALYNLVVISLQSRRLMQRLAILQNVNQFVLFGCVVVALVISPTPEGMVASRLVYSVLTLLIAFGFYRRVQRHDVPFPSFAQIICQMRTVPVRPYWRFGVLNALDKNVATLYTEIPLQLVGVFAGTSAAGFLELGYRAMSIPNLLLSAVFDNLQAVVPQAVGRGDYVRLWRNFRRVMGIMLLGAIAFYLAFALAAPLLVPVLFGSAALPAVPVITVLSIYGAITMMGGIFGPLYRALALLRPALTIKVVVLVILIPGLALVQTEQAVGGAWLVNLLFGVSVVMTAAVTLPALRRQALLMEGSDLG
ncbi:MAG: oligosaccharide flippase family protein [Chloroflexi bacterium]|nr:oligosaccharide flippase family protein [Chloroflexota bacterium]